jgi:hypothetical protein
VVATLTFRALMNGDAGLGFQNLDFVESAIIPLCEGDLETCSTFQPLAINGSPGTVTVRQTAPVPEPAVLALFALGLIGLARRFR